MPQIANVFTETSIREIRFKSGFTINVGMNVKKGRTKGWIIGFLEPNEKPYFIGIAWSDRTEWLLPVQLYDEVILVDGKLISSSDC